MLTNTTEQMIIIIYKAGDNAAYRYGSINIGGLFTQETPVFIGMRTNRPVNIFQQTKIKALREYA